MSPAEHYAKFGYILGRGISPKISDIFADDSCRYALTRKPTISYCIPIMNRGDDIRETLQFNLDNNRSIQHFIEFIVVFLDNDIKTHEWIRSTFAQDLFTGYLRCIVLPPLDSWHFGKAKNKHQSYAIGDIYSSLDGDNFVTSAETIQLLEVNDKYPEGFIFHHFTGNWGDGSSGRISIPMELYRNIGYDETFMPRQFDEMDVLLTSMVRNPTLPLVRIKGKNHGFSSKLCSTFLQAEQLPNKVFEIDDVDRKLPINPKEDNYVNIDKTMSAMTQFNQGLSFMRNTRHPEMREKYLRMAIDGRHKVIDALPREKILATIFQGDFFPSPESLGIKPGDVCAISCMKNDAIFLVEFYNHHKRKGIKHFFIIDDNSDVPIENILPYSDVHIYRPKVGNFLTSKGMWMEALMKAYVSEEEWVLTLDADEFFELPINFKSFGQLTKTLANAGRSYLPALLIDLVPGQLPEKTDWLQFQNEFFQVMDHYVLIDEPVSDEYKRTSSVEWAFGEYAKLSWMLDTRYHAFGTFDSLRKIPLIQHLPGRHLNQGFHTLHHNDKTQDPHTDVWESDIVLTIRHYKLLKLFSGNLREQTAKLGEPGVGSSSSQYHARTAANISRIFGGNVEEKIKSIMELPRHPIDDCFLQSLAPKKFKKVRQP
ncbi:glycosyltransferase family 2 protein [Roseibium sp.]|uniref:glycosyltransferase family 2 protein n=1 Tax=Roseibium sp. TaxID=1936156 RepID=UPI003BACD5D7